MDQTQMLEVFEMRKKASKRKRLMKTLMFFAFSNALFLLAAAMGDGVPGLKWAFVISLIVWACTMAWAGIIEISHLSTDD